MLKKIRRWFILLFIIASMLVGFWVYADNANPVALSLFGFSWEPQPLGLIIIATFTSGVVLGLICNVFVTSWLLFKMKRLEKQPRVPAK